MLLRNTVDPWSNLHRDKTRVGGLMGNRGVIHDRKREVKSKTWESERWICCLRDFKGIDRRPLFKTDPFSYSELFFLDEATAYAAGHRPCNDCRKPDLDLLKRLWVAAGCSGDAGTPIRAADIDAQLHRERLGADGAKRTYLAPLHSLPPGAMLAHGGKAYLVRKQGVRLWAASGYLPAALDATAEVEVLTPKSIVRLISAGLPVQVHASADA